MRPKIAVIAFGAGRALFGVVLLAVPDPITRTWVGSEDVPARVLARCLGGRDVVVGAGTAMAAARDRDPAPWLVGGAVADAVDAATTLAAGERIPRRGRLATVALAGAGIAAGAWLARSVH
ncbi:MAG TPA: hypothetical protein VF257_09355 [Solirubrobacteraceae bacterium]